MDYEYDPHIVETSKPSLLGFFETFWPNIHKNGPHLFLCHSTKNKTYTDICESYGSNCSFSHHPAHFYKVYQGWNRLAWKTNGDYQKWILKFPNENDKTHMNLRWKILSSSGFVKSLQNDVTGYYNRRDEEIIKHDKKMKNDAKKEQDRSINAHNAKIAEQAQKLQKQEDDRKALAQQKEEEKKILREKVVKLVSKAGVSLSAEAFQDIREACHCSSQIFNDFIYAVRICTSVDTLKSLLDDELQFTASFLAMITKSSKRSSKKEEFLKNYNQEKTIFEGLCDRVQRKLPNTKISHHLVTSTVTSALESSITRSTESLCSAEPVMDSAKSVLNSEPLLPSTTLPPPASANQSRLSDQVAEGVISPPSQIMHPIIATAMDYSKYKALCIENYKKAGGEESSLFGNCCVQNLHPSLFECKTCSGTKFCVECIAVHRKGRNALFRKHVYKVFCLECFNHEDVVACELCSNPSEVFRCRPCHEDNHKRVGVGHEFKLNASIDVLTTLMPNDSNDIRSIMLVESEQPPSLSLPPPAQQNHLPAQITPVTKEVQEMINNVRVRVLLEDVVHPVLVVIFKYTWHTFNRFCIGCGQAHPYDKIELDPCISALIETGLLPEKHSARIAYKKAIERHLGNFDPRVYDVTSVCGIIECLCRRAGKAQTNPLYNRFMTLLDTLNDGFHRISFWRNETFHPNGALKIQLCVKAFQELRQHCTNFKQLMDVGFQADPQEWYSRWSDNFSVDHQISMCKSAYTRLEIEKYQKKEWQREAERSSMECISSIIATLPKRETSRKIANLLASSKEAKVLILPPFSERPDMGLLRFLTRISWIGIIDLNIPPLWNINTDDFEPLRLLEDVYEKNSYFHTFGAANILYCNNFDYRFTQIVMSTTEVLRVLVWASGAFVTDTFSIKACIKTIYDQWRPSAQLWKYEILPIFERPNDLLISTNYLRFDFAKTLPDYNQQEMTEREKTEFCLQACRLETVAAYVFAVAQTGCFIIKGHSNSSFGFQVSSLGQFNGSVEILAEGIDDTPGKYQLQDDGLSEEGIKEAIRHDLYEFLSGRAEASWLLFKHVREKTVVEREQLDDIVLRLGAFNTENYPSLFTLVHGIGQGGTTIARHVLYKLRQNGHLCIIIKRVIPRTDYDSFYALLHRFRDTMGVFLAGIIVHVDMNKFSSIDSEKSGMNNFIVSLKEKCHDFCTIFITTSRRHHNLTQHQQTSPSLGLLELNSSLTERERIAFQELLEKSSNAMPKITIRDFYLPLDRFGMLDVGTVEQQPDLVKIIQECSNSELIKGGCTVSDVISLRAITSGDSSDKQCLHSTNCTIYDYVPHDLQQPMISAERSKNTRVLFVGLIAFIPEFKESARQRVHSILSLLSLDEKRVLKLCVFYFLFTYNLKVPYSLAALFYRGGTTLDNDTSFKIAEYSALNDILVIDSRKKVISILNISVAYLLAESTEVFGATDSLIDENKLRISVLRLREYTNLELLDIICGKNDRECMNSAEQKRRDSILIDSAEGLFDAFCNFKVWHPGNVPVKATPVFQQRGKNTSCTLRNSFLVESMERTVSSRSSAYFEVTKVWFERLAKSFKGIDKYGEKFATHASRYIAFKAQQRKNFALSDEAKKIIDESFQKGFEVCDALGNYFKRRVLIYQFLISEKTKYKLLQQSHASAGAVEKSDTREDTSSVYSDEEVDDSSEPTIIPTRTWNNPTDILDIALEGYNWFWKAVVLSSYQNSQPMVAAVQTLVACLHCIRMIVITTRDAHKDFVALLRKPSGDHKVILQRINSERLIEKCTSLLSRARNANLRSNESGTYEHNLKTKETNKYVNINESRLQTYIVSEKYRFQTEPIGFDIVEAKLLLVKGSKSDISTNCSALAWCAVTFLLSITLSMTRKKQEGDGLLYLEDGLSFNEAIEKYFTASALLAGLGLKRPENDPEREWGKYFTIAKARYPDLPKFLLMREVLEKWVSDCTMATEDSKAKSSESSPDKHNNTRNMGSFADLKHTSSFGSHSIITPRSYFGLEARLCRIMLNIWQVLREHYNNNIVAKEDNAELLRRNVIDLKTFSDGLSNSKVPRLFLVDNKLMEGIDNPFSKFIFLEETEIGVECRKHKYEPEIRDQLYRSSKYRNFLKVLTGRLEKKEEDGEFKINCTELGLWIGADNKFLSLGFSEHDEVTFVLGLTERQIRAYGVQHRYPRSTGGRK